MVAIVPSLGKICSLPGEQKFPLMGKIAGINSKAASINSQNGFCKFVNKNDRFKIKMILFS